MADSLPPGRIAGIDFGTVRIGVSISDADRTLASPLETYTRGSASADADYFRQLVQHEQVNLFVVGLPIHLSGEESEKSRQAMQFGAWLSEATGVAVVFYDERFTTRQAEQYLRSGGLTRKRRQQRRDMLAAQVMLAAYLESGQHGTGQPGPLEDEEV